MRLRAIVPLLSASALLVSLSASAAGWRWPWEKPPSNATPTPTPVVLPPMIPPVMVPRPASGESAMLQQLHDHYLQEIAFARIALSRSQAADVRAYADRVISEDGRDDRIVIDRYRQLGLAVPAERQPVSGFELQNLNGTAFDVAYLQRSMNDIDSIRASFADFKEGESDHAFHARLGTMFDDLVSQREQAKSVHDAVRNRSR